MRRTKPEKREKQGDIRYNNLNVTEMINRLMKRGKKSTAVRVLYGSFDLIQERSGKDPIEVFEQALNNVSPILEVKPRRVGGATYQVPVEVAPDRRLSLAIRWILTAARSRGGKSMTERLASELLDAANETGAAMKRREEVHRMAEANRAFASYRW
jgi:small subunit ribosomal protein S7